MRAAARYALQQEFSRAPRIAPRIAKRLALFAACALLNQYMPTLTRFRCQPVYDDICAGASPLTSAAEFHAVTADQSDQGDFEQIVPPKPVCIAFVSWCSPECRRFDPAFNELTKEFPHVRFYRVDLESEEPARLALEQGVTADHQLPVFKFWHNGIEIGPPVEGAKRDELRAALQRVEA
jgi:hypothetical protein